MEAPFQRSSGVPDAIAYFNDPNNVAYCLANTYGTCTVNPPQRAFVAIVSTKPGIPLTQSDPAGSISIS